MRIPATIGSSEAAAQILKYVLRFKGRKITYQQFVNFYFYCDKSSTEFSLYFFFTSHLFLRAVFDFLFIYS